MVDLGAYRDKFGDSGQRVLENALSESRRRDQNFIAVEHIIFALAKEEPDLFNSTIRSLAIDPDVVTQAINKRLNSTRQHVGKGFRIASDALTRSHRRSAAKKKFNRWWKSSVIASVPTLRCWSASRVSVKPQSSKAWRG